MDNFIWNAALSWFRFVEEHNDINQITFNQVNLRAGPVNGTRWNTVARRKDTAINFLSGLCHEGPLKHQTSWRRIHWIESYHPLKSIEKLEAGNFPRSLFWSSDDGPGRLGKYRVMWGSSQPNWWVDAFEYLSMATYRAVPEIIQRCVWMFRKNACWSSVKTFFFLKTFFFKHEVNLVNDHILWKIQQPVEFQP